MVFDSPAWFWLLIPWSGLVFYLLRKVRSGTGIPFLPFWPNEGFVKPQVAYGVPPGWVILFLIAILVGIAAAARPGARGVDADRSAVVIVDRGRSLEDDGAYRRAVAEAKLVLDRFRVGGRVRIISVPGVDREMSADQFETIAEGLPPSAVDASGDVRSAVDRAVRESGGPVVVVTGSVVRAASARVVGVGSHSAEGTAITSFSVRTTPKETAMVRLRAAASGSVLNIRGDGVEINQPIKTADEFVNLSSVPEFLEATIGGGLDGQRWVARQSEAAWLDPAATIDASVQRLCRIYSKRHPPTPRGGRVSIGPAVPVGPGVILASDGTGGDAGPVAISDPVLTRDVTSWPAAGSATTVPAGYRVVATENKLPVIAIGTEKDRQVWINLDLKSWSSTPAFVIFFENVFDYVTGGESVYGSIGPIRLGNGWKQAAGKSPGGVDVGMWPGVYRSDDGRLMAVNAEPAAAGEIVVSDGAGVAIDRSADHVGWGVWIVIGVMISILLGTLKRGVRR